jgi:ABC-type multidrug transport system fused ATPase/permease subunit
LDEATSALDSESEHVVQEAIDAMIRGQRGYAVNDPLSRTMTVVIVAHRLSTVKNADRIVVIQKGRIAEQGSHEELMAKKDSVYSHLVQKQLHSSSSSLD